VDEAGTEAGAATAVIFGDESAPVQPEIDFTADRPFIIMIQDIPSSAVLFAGRVAEL
jgi:serpin B